MNRRRLLPVALATVFALGVAIGARSQSTEAPIYHPEAQVYFSPRGGAQSVIIREVDGARVSIRVQAYSFTSAPIIAALVRAHARGVEVFVLLDKSQLRGKNSGADDTAGAGIPTGIDPKHPIAHSKIIVVDGETVLTGSFNFSKAAEEKNAENLLVLRDPSLAARYIVNWNAHAAHSYKINADGTPSTDAPKAATLEAQGARP